MPIPVTIPIIAVTCQGGGAAREERVARLGSCEVDAIGAVKVVGVGLGGLGGARVRSWGDTTR